MQACLGLFVFNTRTLPITSRDRSTTWRHARSAPIGKRATNQFVGPGDDTITLTGELAHDIAGLPITLDVLRAMADQGKSHVLVMGNGQILGAFVIDQVTENSTNLFANGTPRSITFTIQLTRSNDDLIDKLALYSSALSLLS